VFAIVGTEDSDRAAGLVSDLSPLGHALLGHWRGDRVAVRAPGGARTVAIVEVE
jgi:transcription elongation factor GreA